jgi:hypothetical protein
LHKSWLQWLPYPILERRVFFLMCFWQTKLWWGIIIIHCACF